MDDREHGLDVHQLRDGWTTMWLDRDASGAQMTELPPDTVRGRGMDRLRDLAARFAFTPEFDRGLDGLHSPSKHPGFGVRRYGPDW
jgi:hypothetical protein